jgi:hypothetical protein
MKIADLILIHTPTKEIWEETQKLLFEYGFNWDEWGNLYLRFPEEYINSKPCIALYRDRKQMEYCYTDYYFTSSKYNSLEKVIMEYEDILEFNNVWELEEAKCVL